MQSNQNATQLGFLISKKPLNNGKFNVHETGFRSLVRRKHLDKSFVLGPKSLGAFFEKAGYAAVPSPRHPGPGSFFVHNNII